MYYVPCDYSSTSGKTRPIWPCTDTLQTVQAANQKRQTSLISTQVAYIHIRVNWKGTRCVQISWFPNASGLTAVSKDKSNKVSVSNRLKLRWNKWYQIAYRQANSFLSMWKYSFKYPRWHTWKLSSFIAQMTYFTGDRLTVQLDRGKCLSAWDPTYKTFEHINGGLDEIVGLCGTDKLIQPFVFSLLSQ